MSTKLHHGYRYVSLSGSADPFALAEGLRTHVTPAVALLSHRALVAAAVDDVDRGVADSMPLMAVGRRFAEEVGEARRTRTRCSRDFSVSVSVLADPADPAVLLLLVFCEHDVRDAMLAVPGVEYFGYWNNTDRPDDVSDDEWTARFEAWERTLGWDAPVDRGLVWEASELSSDWVTLLHRDDRNTYIESLIPDRVSRATSLLRRAAADTVTPDPSWQPWQVVRAVMSAAEAATEDPATVEQFASTLPELSASDLTGAR